MWLRLQLLHGVDRNHTQASLLTINLSHAENSARRARITTLLIFSEETPESEFPGEGVSEAESPGEEVSETESPGKVVSEPESPGEGVSELDEGVSEPESPGVSEPKSPGKVVPEPGERAPEEIEGG